MVYLIKAVDGVLEFKIHANSIDSALDIFVDYLIQLSGEKFFWKQCTAELVLYVYKVFRKRGKGEPKYFSVKQFNHSGPE